MLDLIVSYADKEDVKRRGAFWDIERKVWVIPDHVCEIKAFKAWIPFQKACIVRKPYFICLYKANCWKYGQEISGFHAANYKVTSSISKNPEAHIFSKQGLRVDMVNSPSSLY